MSSEENRDMLKTGKEIPRFKQLSVPHGFLFVLIFLSLFVSLSCKVVTFPPPSLLTFSFTVILVLAVAEICSLRLLLLSPSDSKYKNCPYPAFAVSLLPHLPSLLPLSLFSSFLPLFLPSSFPSLLPFISWDIASL